MHGVIFFKLPRSAHGHRITGEKKPKERSLEQSLLLCAWIEGPKHRANPNPNAAMIILYRPFSVLRLVQFRFPPSLPATCFSLSYITCGLLGRHRSRAYPRAPADAPSAGTCPDSASGRRFSCLRYCAYYGMAACGSPLVIFIPHYQAPTDTLTPRAWLAVNPGSVDR